jgi:hypothetical protein
VRDSSAAASLEVPGSPIVPIFGLCRLDSVCVAQREPASCDVGAILSGCRLHFCAPGQRRLIRPVLRLSLRAGFRLIVRASRRISLGPRAPGRPGLVGPIQVCVPCPSVNRVTGPVCITAVGCALL